MSIIVFLAPSTNSIWMRKILIVLFTSIAFFSQAQNFSTINFICRGSLGDYYAIYLNGHPLGTFKGSETLIYKIYSEGTLPVTVIWNDKKKSEETITIKNGEMYYYESFWASERKVNHLKGRGLMKENKTVFNAEEDKANPVTKGLPVIFDAPKTEKTSSKSNDKVSKASKNDARQGTGFSIGKKGYVLTSYHLVSEAKAVQVKGIGGDFSMLYGADVVQYDSDLDLALLKIKNPNISFDSIPYILSSETNAPETKSFILGYPLKADTGEIIKMTEGTVTSKNGYKGTLSQYSFSKPVEAGNSGSPLFNEKGDVIGIINTKWGSSEEASYAVKSQYIQTFMSLAGIVPPVASSSADLNQQDRITRLKNYVFIVKVE